MTTDPLHDALRDATLAVLLGTQTQPTQQWDNQGNSFIGLVTIESAFVQRIREKANKGEFDYIITAAMENITADDVIGVIKDVIGQQVLKGLEPVTPTSGYGRTPTPGWLQEQTKNLTVEALTTALSGDDDLLDTLRARIGAQVDRNQVGITVSLSDPER